MLITLLLACRSPALQPTDGSEEVPGGAADTAPSGGDSAGGDSAGDGGEGSGGSPPLAEALGPGQVRAGVISDGTELIGGVAAEGAPGDIKLYNDRVRFVIQAPRTGHQVTGVGGHVIDADIVRAADRDGAPPPGRDMVVEWLSVAGLGHTVRAESVEVADDGASSGRAVVVVTGAEEPLDYLSGVIEDPEFIPPLGMRFRIEYALSADSPLLEVTTTITAGDRDLVLEGGDLLLAASSAGRAWSPGAALGEVPEQAGWYASVGDRGEGALAVLAAPGEVLEAAPGLSLFDTFLTLTTAYGRELEIPAGGSATHRRYYGVGPDTAALTDAWLALAGQPTDTAAGQVSAPDGPVAGARVTVLADGEPWTLAITDEDGRFSAAVPEGAAVDYRADGRGAGWYVDLPEGAEPYSPYAAPELRQRALDSLVGGGAPIPVAAGRGFGSEGDPLTLGEPAWLTLSSADGSPFEARLAFDGEDPAAPDARFVLPRPGGYAAVAWTPDGELRLPVEPGRYTLIAWRGARHELHTEAITLAPGEERALTVDLPEAYPRPEGWRLADLHAHAAPSADGGVTMAHRLVIAEAVGLDRLLGSDHDHVVDYAPLLGPLGVAVRTLVADEVSSALRGHLNAYPLVPDEGAMNGGAWLWWQQVPEDTEGLTDDLRAAYPTALLQVNHPMNGLAAAAGWSPGAIADGAWWTEDFDAIEVLNAGLTDGYEFYMDLALRGLLAAPVGVSDAHGYLDGDPGLSATWLFTDEAADAADDTSVKHALLGRRTVVSRGPFLELSIAPGAAAQPGTSLSVRALSPSWIHVDELQLLRDGEVAQTAAGTAATFTLDAETDALFTVIARGDSAMAPVSELTPWAMSAPILVDVGGDGWTPPLPPLTIGPAR